MDKLTNIVESILFASGKTVAIADIAEKLGVSEGEVKGALKALRAKYGEDGGIQLLEFNKKAQLASNPAYKDWVYAVLNPIREKELTRTILECAAIIAYKQPITRTEIELLRGVNSDYAVNVLLDLKLIAPCGRKDAVGHPILFGTTDEFLKRFKLASIADLPNYEALMEAISRPAERDSYLYAREEYDAAAESAMADGAEEDAEGNAKQAKSGSDDDGGAPPPEVKPEEVAGGYEIPDFLSALDASDIIKIS